MGRHLLKGFVSVLVSLLFAELAVAADTAKEEGFFPRNSNVILLAGLPGDLESETLYAEQLGAWIELIVKSERVQKLFVLCDNPSSISLPAHGWEPNSIPATACRMDIPRTGF